MIHTTLLIAFVVGAMAQEPAPSSEPWVVVCLPPFYRWDNLQNPQLLVASDGSYVISVEHSGHYSSQIGTYVYRSTDRGTTWAHQASLRVPRHNSLFEAGRALHLIGIDGTGRSFWGRPMVRKSDDWGASWSNPESRSTGRFPDDSPLGSWQVPAVVQGGRVWRSFTRENIEDPRLHFILVASARLDDDLLRADRWTWSDILDFEGFFVGATMGSSLAPGPGSTPLLLAHGKQPDFRIGGELSSDGGHIEPRVEAASWSLPDSAAGKRVVRDEKSGLLHALTIRTIPPQDGSVYEVALTSSAGLVVWETRSVLLRLKGVGGLAWSSDWAIDGEDLLVALVAWFPRESTPEYPRKTGPMVVFLRVPVFRPPTPETPPLWDGRE